MWIRHSNCKLRLDAEGRIWLDLDLAFVCITHYPCNELRLDAVGWIWLNLDVPSLVSVIPISTICVWMPWGGFDECWMCPQVDWSFQLQKKTTNGCRGAGLVGVGCGLICIHHSTCKELRMDAVWRVWFDLDRGFSNVSMPLLS